MRTFWHLYQIQNCHLQTFSVWKSLKFVVWERVKYRKSWRIKLRMFLKMVDKYAPWILRDRTLYNTSSLLTNLRKKPMRNIVEKGKKTLVTSINPLTCSGESVGNRLFSFHHNVSTRGPWWPWIAYLSHLPHKWTLHLCSFGSNLWPPGWSQFWSQGASYEWNWQRSTRMLHTKNLSSIPSSFREEEFWSWSSLFLCSNLWPQGSGVSFDPKGIIWIQLIKVHKEMLNTK